MEASSIDEISENHPNCKIITSLIDLPAEAGKFKVWQKDNPSKFALPMPYLRVIGFRTIVQNDFQRGKIIAAAVLNPDSGKSLIIHAGNVEEILSSYPKLLRLRKRL